MNHTTDERRLTGLVSDFRAAGDREADETWAARALMRLTFSDISSHEVRQALSEALEVVRASGEPALDVLGDPDEWVDAQVATRSEQGATFVDDQPDMNSLAVVSLGAAGLVALVFAAVLFAKYHSHAPFDGWLAAVPLVFGPAPVLLEAARERLLRRHSNAVAWAAYAALAVAAVAVGVALVFFGNHAPHRPVWWWLAEAVVLFGLAGLAGRLIPERTPRLVRARGSRAVGDDEWTEHARATLRARGDFTERQVDEMLAEARAHAAQGGTSLAEEFGNPVGYAGRMPADQVVVHRRKALFNALLLLCVLVASWGDGWGWSSWFRILAVALFGWEVLPHGWAWWQARRRRAHRR